MKGSVSVQGDEHTTVSCMLMGRGGKGGSGWGTGEVYRQETKSQDLLRKDDGKCDLERREGTERDCRMRRV